MLISLISLIIICMTFLAAVSIYCWKSYKTNWEINVHKTLYDKECIRNRYLEQELLKMTEERDKLQERIDKHNSKSIGTARL